MAYDDALTADPLGDKSTPEGMRKHATRRLRSMRAQRGGQEPLWMEIARFCQPTVGRHLAAYGTAGTAGEVSIRPADTINTKLLDSRAVHAADTLSSGMYSGLTSPSRPWFKLTLSDPELRKFQVVKEWLDIVEQRIYDLFSKTNFYTNIRSGYHELGVFGNEAGLMEQHWKYGMVTHPLTTGEYWFGLDDGLVPDSLYRRVDMTVLQHYERFLKGRSAGAVLPRRVIEQYDRGNYDQTFPVYNAIEPNSIRQLDRMDAKGKLFSSIYWSGACDEAEGAMHEKALLSQEGFNSKPFWTARWEVRGSDVYSSMSPGLRALADTRQLQLQVLRKQQAIDFGIKPALRGPATLNNLHVALQPGRITAMANVDKDSFGAIWEVRAEMINAISQDTQMTREAVDRGFYADLFNAITNMRGVQPRNVEEIASRNEEKLTQLGPVVERVHQEKLKVCIDRAYDIGMRGGLFPPPPEEMQGQEIDVEFISVLAQAQRMVGIGSIERTFGFATSIAQAFPDALDALDADAAMDEYGDITGVAAKIMRSPEERTKIREARAQAQQQAQAAEMAATMAPAAKAGAETAALLYDSPGIGSSPNLSDRLLGTN